MGKRVVEGGPIRFKEDLPIDAAEIAKPLALPPFSILPDRFTVWYKARFYELGGAAGKAFARIWRREYGLREAEAAGAREERFFKSPDVAKAQREWLGRVLPGADLSKRLGPQVAQVVKEKIEELCAVAGRAPQRDVGRGTTRRSADASVLGEMHGHQRFLHVDGKIYDLLSLAEYLATFEKAFDPALFKSLQKECDAATPEDVVRTMAGSLDRMDKKTYGVIRGKVHYDDRTFELRLDGVYFIPEYLCAAAEFQKAYRVLAEKRLKVDAVKNLA